MCLAKSCGRWALRQMKIGRMGMVGKAVRLVSKLSAWEGVTRMSKEGICVIHWTTVGRGR